jgi:hypothetical protein
MANPNERGVNPQQSSPSRLPSGLGQGRPGGPGTAEQPKGVAATVSETADQVKDKIQDVASSVAHSAESAWESTKHGVEKGARAVAETAEDAWEKFTGLVRRYPAASVAVAFGLGCLCMGLCSSLFGSSGHVTRQMSRYSA